PSLGPPSPAPAVFPGGPFSFARGTFGFEGGLTMHLTLTRNCQVRKPAGSGEQSANATEGESNEREGRQLEAPPDRRGHRRRRGDRGRRAPQRLWRRWQ